MFALHNKPTILLVDKDPHRLKTQKTGKTLMERRHTLVGKAKVLPHTPKPQVFQHRAKANRRERRRLNEEKDSNKDCITSVQSVYLFSTVFQFRENKCKWQTLPPLTKTHAKNQAFKISISTKSFSVH